MHYTKHKQHFWLWFCCLSVWQNTCSIQTHSILLFKSLHSFRQLSIIIYSPWFAAKSTKIDFMMYGILCQKRLVISKLEDERFERIFFVRGLCYFMWSFAEACSHPRGTFNCALAFTFVLSWTCGCVCSDFFSSLPVQIFDECKGLSRRALICIDYLHPYYCFSLARFKANKAHQKQFFFALPLFICCLLYACTMYDIVLLSTLFAVIFCCCLRLNLLTEHLVIIASVMKPHIANIQLIC